MSNQSTTKSESSPRTDRELATALRVMALATQDRSPIFQLNVDCCEEIFDWLSLDDLHSFAQTCKFFQRIAGKYFEWKYRKIWVHVYKNEMNFHCKSLEGFKEFAQKLYFLDFEPEELLTYASANCASPKELKIQYVHPTAIDVNRLENMLASVEVLIFINLYIADELMESILKVCAPNLKRLAIERTTRCKWMQHKYPNLQHFELYECKSTKELVKFLRRNPNIRYFSTDTEYILKYQSKFMTSTIELDDLTVRGESTMDGIPDTFNDLYKRGFYKRLHFATYSNEHLGDLPGLTTLDVDTQYYFDLPRLPNVTRLSFQPIWFGMDSWLNKDEILDAFPNLEYVLINNYANMKFIMPFIRNAKKLKEIKMKYISNNHKADIDPVLMNSEREKLNGAHKVTIYVEEQVYLMIKWKYGRNDFGLIQFKRRESYDGVLNHCFDVYYE